MQFLAGMRSATLGIALLGVVAGLSHSGSARACGASPTPFYVVASQAPDGDATPLNAPLVVLLREEPSIPEGPQLAASLTLTKEGADETVALRALGYGLEQAWIPVEQLEPETTYAARFNTGYEGIPDTSWTFTTGSEAAPALSLEGALEATLEQGMGVFQSCPPTACPCGCTGADSAASCTSYDIPVTRARVKIPRAADGFAGRRGTLYVTDDKPYDVTPPSKTAPEPYTGLNVSISQFVDLDDPSVTEVVIDLPEENVDYRPCFAFSARDARGDQATIQSLCLDEVVPTYAHGSDNPDSGNDLVDDVLEPKGTSEGCSLSAAPSGSGAWLALVGLVSVVRRRRAARS